MSLQMRIGHHESENWQVIRKVKVKETKLMKRKIVSNFWAMWMWIGDPLLLLFLYGILSSLISSLYYNHLTTYSTHQKETDHKASKSHVMSLKDCRWKKCKTQCEKSKSWFLDVNIYYFNEALGYFECVCVCVIISFNERNKRKTNLPSS